MSRKNCRISVFTQKFGFWSERNMDIWNNMPPFLVFSYAKSIAIKFWQLQNKIEEKILIWKALFVIPSIPTRNYLFKVSNWSKRITRENCSRLGKKPLEQCQWRRSRVCIGLYFKLSANYWLWTGKGLLGSYRKGKHFWRQDQEYHPLTCSNLSVTKIY